MEVRKRQRPISTPAFHELADDITTKSRDVFRMAIAEEQVGDAAPTGDETIDDIAQDRLGEGG
jgi:hypothetical protein